MNTEEFLEQSLLDYVYEHYESQGGSIPAVKSRYTKTPFPHIIITLKFSMPFVDYAKTPEIHNHTPAFVTKIYYPIDPDNWDTKLLLSREDFAESSSERKKKREAFRLSHPVRSLFIQNQ